MGLKSIFDGLYVDQLIQKNERGETIVYPHGMMGRGYVLPDAEVPRYRQRVRTVMLVSLIIGISYGSSLLRLHDVTPLGWAVIVGIGALLIGGIVYYQSRLTTGLTPVAGPRLSIGEWLRRGRQARPTWTYWFSAICGLLLAFASVAAISVGVADSDWLVTGCSIFLLGVSVLFGIDGVIGLKERRKAK